MTHCCERDDGAPPLVLRVQAGHKAPLSPGCSEWGEIAAAI